jgi:hypothetical protein
MGDDFASSGRTIMGATHPEPNTPEQRHFAARVVADHAHTVDDCIELLDMLGLDAAEGKVPPATAEDMQPHVPSDKPLRRNWNPYKRRWTQK